MSFFCGKSSNKVPNKNQKTLDLIKELKPKHPNNITLQVFCPKYYETLSPENQDLLLKCMASGIENPSSSMGCYANQPSDYATLRPFFQKALEKYHNVDLTKKKHENNWDLSKVPNLPDQKLDLTSLGLPPLSMRVRVGRNLKKYPLPASMTRDDRVNLENDMKKVFDELVKNPDFGGRYNSITPGSPDFVDEAGYQSLVD